MEESLKLRFDRIGADAGYESEENLTYLKSKGIEAYIKPSNYEQIGTRNSQNKLVANKTCSITKQMTAIYASTEKELEKPEVEKLKQSPAM